MQDHLIDKNDLPEKIIPKAKYIDMSGKKSGKLTILYPCGYLGKEKRLAWLCQCECGNYVEVIGKNLRNNNTTSCGCYQKQRAVESNIARGKPIKPGDRFGKLTIIDFVGFGYSNNGKRQSLYKCQCDCGKQVIKKAVYLRFGDTNSCGCLSSVGESVIGQFLDKYNIPDKTQVTFDGLVSKKGNKLKFDFQINNFLIEYQGEVHFQEGIRHQGWNTQEAFEERVERDNLKKMFCKKNNIKLYEITYKDDTIEKLIEILTMEGIMSDDE